MDFPGSFKYLTLTINRETVEASRQQVEDERNIRRKSSTEPFSFTLERAASKNVKLPLDVESSYAKWKEVDVFEAISWC